MPTPRLIMFDLDGTLALSKQPMDAPMATLIRELIAITKVAVISGGGFLQFEKQFLESLGEHGLAFANLYLMPTSGAALYHYQDGSWKEAYSETLTPDEKSRIEAALHSAIADSGYPAPEATYGETIEDRGSQISYSANGQEAPLTIKTAWDPTREKREHIVSLLSPLLPGFSIRIGGTNTIDITKPGIDKAYGIHRISEMLGIPESEMLYIGDAIYPGGNDFAVTSTDVPWKKVAGPEETKELISELLA